MTKSSERLIRSMTEQQKKGGRKIIRASESCKREMIARFEDFQTRSSNPKLRRSKTMLGSRTKRTVLSRNHDTNPDMKYFRALDRNPKVKRADGNTAQ